MFLAAVLVAWRLSFVDLVFPLLFALSRQNLLVFGRVFVCENRAGDRKVRWSGVGGLCAYCGMQMSFLERCKWNYETKGTNE